MLLFTSARGPGGRPRRVRYFDPADPVLTGRADPTTGLEDSSPAEPDGLAFVLLREGGLDDVALDRLRLFLRYEEAAIVAELLGLDPGHACRLRQRLLHRARLILLAGVIRQALGERSPVVIDPGTGSVCEGLHPADLVPGGRAVLTCLCLEELVRALTPIRDADPGPELLLCAWKEDRGCRLQTGRLPPGGPALARLPRDPRDAGPALAALLLAA